jgi:uncharacterized protein YbbK (DUF523 family)
MILVSACLAGNRCRYDGHSSFCPKILALIKAGKAVAFCPEQAGGLPTPRPPVEIKNGRAMTKNGNDVTQVFEKGAREGLAVAKKFNCTEAILKARSPSCGKGAVYDGTFSKKLIKGNGVFAGLLMKNGITVTSEEGI